MIKRIVQLTLEPEFIEEFKVFFEARKATINSFEGCTFLELWQDVQEPHKFFTHSIWQSEDHLNRYRNSAFFKETWIQTKAMFAEKAQAWTVTIIA
jgi:heme-degrading monooxygenase HmoA